MRPYTIDLSGKVALLTGAGRGIGLAMGRALAAHGAVVALQDIEQDVAQVEADKINAEGGRAIAVGGDLTDLATPEQVVARVRERLGPVSILVNNASVQSRTRWTDLSVEEIQQTLDANWIAPFLLARILMPTMRAAKWGRIINVGSGQQRSGNPGMAAYSASKAALMNLTTGLARDGAADGVTSNCIAPGWFNTDRNRDELPDEEAVRRAGKHVPMQRLGVPTDCDGITLMLCSDLASYITGQCVYVCGGASFR